MKYEFMEHYRSCFRVERMCHALSVSKSGYYAWRRRKVSNREEQNMTLLEKIQAIHEQSRRLYGSPRMTQELKAQSVCCSENRIARLMRENGIGAKVKRKFRRTGRSTVKLATYADNLLNRQFAQTSPDQVWVTDLTYIWTREGCLHMVAVLDLYSRTIVGWAASKHPSAKLALKALQRAMDKRRPSQGLIVHTDRGTQFASYEYQDFLKDHGYVPSMNRQGNCWDNAVMESFFHTLKMEHVYWESFRTREEATLSIFNYIELFYNSWRLHSSLNFKSPLEYERMNNIA